MGNPCTRRPALRLGPLTDERPEPRGSSLRRPSDWSPLGVTDGSGGRKDMDRLDAVSTDGRRAIAMPRIVAASPQFPIIRSLDHCGRTGDNSRTPADNRAYAPSYSKPIFSSTRYSTISPFSTAAVDFTT